VRNCPELRSKIAAEQPAALLDSMYGIYLIYATLKQGKTTKLRVSVSV